MCMYHHVCLQRSLFLTIILYSSPNRDACRAVERSHLPLHWVLPGTISTNKCNMVPGALYHSGFNHPTYSTEKKKKTSTRPLHHVSKRRNNNYQVPGCLDSGILLVLPVITRCAKTRGSMNIGLTTRVQQRQQKYQTLNSLVSTRQHIRPGTERLQRYSSSMR